MLGCLFDRFQFLVLDVSESFDSVVDYCSSWMFTEMGFSFHVNVRNLLVELHSNNISFIRHFEIVHILGRIRAIMFTCNY